MKVITLSELNTVNPRDECFIVKKVFTGNDCYKAVDELSAFLKSTKDNERCRGENWHYRVKKQAIEFESFIFHDLRQLNNPILTRFYETLFNMYVALGVEFHFKTFMEQAFPIDDMEIPIITPLVFWYPAGVGKFAWHQHPGDYQDFQLLTNLTRPNVDYRGGRPSCARANMRRKYLTRGSSRGMFSVSPIPAGIW